MVFVPAIRLYLFYFSLTLVEIVVISNDSAEDNSNGYGSIYASLNEHMKSNFLNYEVPKVDFLKEDDDGDWDLANIMSLSEATVSSDIDAYSSFDKIVTIDIHNLYRSNFTKPIPEGSDVMYTEWNDTLAWAAADWLKECKLTHGYGKNDNMTSQQGQNLYQGPSTLPSRSIYLWYEEYKNYFFHNFSCKQPFPKYQCGHMTQVLWFDSAQIGCARKSNCYPQEPSNKFVNCHYYRRGNLDVPGIQIYKYGWQCTRCENSDDGNLCYHGLCVSKKTCKNYKLECECKLDCKNCVKPDYKACRCAPCKSGWDWPDCSYPCSNAIDEARKKSGFCKWKVTVLTKKICKDKEFLSACRQECGGCKPLDMTNKVDTCCDGKLCPHPYILDDSCNCMLDCPSKLCLFPSPTRKTKPPAVLNATQKPKHGIKDPKRKKVKVPSKSHGRSGSVLTSLSLLALSILLLNT